MSMPHERGHGDRDAGVVERYCDPNMIVPGIPATVKTNEITFTLDVGMAYEPDGRGLRTFVVVYGADYPSFSTRLFFYN